MQGGSQELYPEAPIRQPLNPGPRLRGYRHQWLCALSVAFITTDKADRKPTRTPPYDGLALIVDPIVLPTDRAAGMFPTYNSPSHRSNPIDTKK